jgi:hypothetical protein
MPPPPSTHVLSWMPRRRVCVDVPCNSSHRRSALESRGARFALLQQQSEPAWWCCSLAAAPALPNGRQLASRLVLLLSKQINLSRQRRLLVQVGSLRRLPRPPC